MTITEVLQQATEACVEAAKTNTLEDLSVGDEVTITVDTDALGAIDVVVSVPAPLRPTRGQRMTMSARPVLDVTLPSRPA